MRGFFRISEKRAIHSGILRESLKNEAICCSIATYPLPICGEFKRERRKREPCKLPCRFLQRTSYGLSITFCQKKFKLYLPVPCSFPVRPSPMGNFCSSILTCRALFFTSYNCYTCACSKPICSSIY